MLSADAAFIATANAAARACAATPPHVRARVRVVTTRERGTDVATADVDLDLESGSAHVVPRDPPGEPYDGPPPALPVVLDPLAEWGFRLVDDGTATPRLVVAYERPKTYAAPLSTADVVVPSVRGYAVRYAPADSSRLLLAPATPSMREYATIGGDFVWREVVVDPVSGLPSRIVLNAPGETLALDFATAPTWRLTRVVDTFTDERSHLRSIEATYDAEAATSP